MKGFKSTSTNPYTYTQSGVWKAGQYTFQAVVLSDSGYAFAFQRSDTAWQTVDLSWQVKDGSYSKIQWTFTLEVDAVAFRLIANTVTGETTVLQPMLEKGSNGSTPIAHEEDLRGMDGIGEEFIFKANNSDTEPPVLPQTTDTNYQDDDYYGQGTANEWNDDPVAPTELNQFVWVAKRKKIGGIWEAFGTPSIWTKWVTDGHSPYINETTNTWWEWNDATGQYENTGYSPVGSDGRIPYPAGYWEAKTYTRDANYAPYVQHTTAVYLLVDDLAEPTDVPGSPGSSDKWKAFNNWTAVFVDSLVAAFAKIGGAVFTGNTDPSSTIKGRMISEMGVDGTSNFSSYTGDSGSWQPKLMLDFVNGLIVGDDVKIRGEINALTGTLGELTIAAGGFIDLPPQFISDIQGRIDSAGIQLVYSGADSQSISWHTGISGYSGIIQPNSSGHLTISSGYGLDFNSEGSINIGSNDISGAVYIGNILKPVDFGGAAVSNISRLASLGFTSFAYTTLAMAATTNYTVSSDTTMLIITSSGGSAGILKLMAAGGASPSNGMVKIIVNTTSVKVYLRCTTAGTNISYGSPITEYQMHANSVALLVYYNGAWRVHNDIGQ